MKQELIIDITNLNKETLEELQDVITGIIEGKFIIITKTHCDVCGVLKELTKVDTNCGIINICESCRK